MPAIKKKTHILPEKNERIWVGLSDNNNKKKIDYVISSNKLKVRNFRVNSDN